MALLLTVVFVLSGAAGLIYESIWSRYLSLFVGHSAYAQVIVLVIYLGGMSAGAAIAARWSSRVREPLFGYAFAEIAVGIIGLFFHEIFLGVSAYAYASLFPALAGGPALVIVKWMLAGLLILPQSLLLGTTFPLMSAGLLRRVSPDGHSGSGRTLSVLYFANSIGAAAGVLIAGFYLIQAVGLPGTLLAAAIANLVSGFTVFAVVRLTQDAEETPAVPNAAAPSHEPAGAGAPTAAPVAAPELATLWKVMLAVAAGTALSSFIYEIAWVRMLSLVLGSATHSFELMLSAFILGLSLGAFWVRSRADRFRDPVKALGVTQWWMGALAVLTLAAFLASFHWMATLIHALDQNEQGYRFFTVSKYAIALSVMLPATFCAGITLPLITRILLAAGSGERAIGTVYSVNTLGSIVGAGLASLVLMPWLGLKTLLVGGGVIDMALGIWLLFHAGRVSMSARRLGILASGAMAIVLLYAVMSVPFDRGVLISGVYRYGRVPAPGSVRLVFYKDGRTATVSVRKAEDGGFSLATNGKPDASLSPVWFYHDTTAVAKQLDGDESTQVLLPMITLAHAPGAKRAAVIGNGSGMSSHLLLGSPALEKLVTIDIEPEMIRASRTFYPVNRRNFDDPRSQFVHDDAKSYFAATNQKFDLILSEPSNPWVSGVSGLFTDEFYQRIRTYLTPKGVFGQWLHLYEIDDALVLSVIKAVHKNFPSYQVFLTADVDILIVASNQPVLPRPDWRVMDLPDIRDDLHRFRRIDAEALEGTRLVSRDALAPLIGAGVGANSDFYPSLDLGTELTRYMKKYATGFSGLADSRFDVGAALTGTVLPPSSESLASLDIARPKALALGHRLRTGTFTTASLEGEDKATRVAVSQMETLRDIMAAGHAPLDWQIFFKLATDVESNLHGGTMGWTDEPFYAGVTRFLDAQHAPSDARAAWRFLHAAAGYQWTAAAAEVDSLVAARMQERRWLDDDLLRDAAVVALIKTGAPARARGVFDRLDEFTTRKSDDLRVRLLDAHLREAERRAGPKVTSR
ncbi:MAG: spermidine synthase [Proteobacteria bacterium]|nr:spermidine synthase [Pseudomonadota bacterium]